MNDKLVFGYLVYILLSSAIVSQLPDSFFTGSSTSIDRDSIYQSLNSSSMSGNDKDVSLNALTKITKFMFVGWTISGVPTIIGLLISLVNIIGIIFGIVWLGNKVRGIS